MKGLKSNRLNYIDALRGFTILLVVYFHVLFLAIFPGEGDLANQSHIVQICSRFRMPLFFCISGFFSYGFYSLEVFKRRVKNRIFQQLWPTALIALIYIYLCKWGGVNDFVHHPTKAGYWFTYSLFQVFILFSIIMFVLSHYNSTKLLQGILFSIIALLCFAIASVIRRLPGNIIDSDMSRILSLDRTLVLSTYFYFGVLMRLYFKQLVMVFENRWFFGLVFILFIVSLFYDSSLIVRVSGYFGILLVFGVFYYTRNYWDKNNLVSRTLRSFGGKTLPIYLFHYFIIYLIAETGILFILRPYVGQSWIEFPIIFLISIIIAALCVSIDNVIEKVKPLHRIMFGK